MLLRREAALLSSSLGGSGLGSATGSVAASGASGTHTVQSTLGALAERVPARLLLPAVFAAYRQCAANGSASAVRLLDFLAQIVAQVCVGPLVMRERY